jgi:ParB/RepB/Spo0J family partition protein
MQKPKKLAAMDLLVKNASLKPALSQESLLSRNPISNLQNGVPVEISPDACRAWRLADRPPNEALHKDELVKSFQDGGIGQIQPIVVRQIKGPDVPGIEYEVICGRVRWLAAQTLGILVQAIVRELNDQEAYVLMSTENKQRRNLSDFAKAKSYQKALALGVFDTAQDLADAEGISKSKLSLYLGFAELSDVVVQKFSDITKVPYRLGYEINKTSKAIGIEETLKIIPSIESGSLSRIDVQSMQANIITSASSRTDNHPPMAETYAVPDPPADAPALLSDSNGQNPKIENPIPASETMGTNGLLTAETPVQSIIQTQPTVKNIFLSSSGHKLFTYNNASRGLLIRIAPEVSMMMSEAFMHDLGRLIEAYCDKAV